jgi:hypothetical protein
MFRSYQWTDLPDKAEFLQLLLQAFGKDRHHLDRLSTRFEHHDTQVDLFYPENALEWVGACVHWQEDGYRYLDKLFVTPVTQKGWGRQLFDSWLQLHSGTRFVWRTNQDLAERFYGKHRLVYTLYRKEDYVYQTVETASPLLHVREVEGAFKN